MLLSWEQLLSHYPRIIHDHKRDIIREYLQHLFLKYLFVGPKAKNLIFIGGTALRIMYGLPRFSEDLDFDNTGISYDEFQHTIEYLIQQLEISNIQVDITYTEKIAYHANVRIKNILTHYNLAPNTREEVREKLPIKIDTHSQGLGYKPELIPLRTFGVNALVQVAPLSVLMAMKIFTIGERKRAKGRDYIDLKFLMDRGVKPDYGIVEKLCGYTTKKQIQDHLSSIINNKDKSYLIRDVQPFLFNSYDDSIEHFEQYVNNYQR